MDNPHKPTRLFGNLPEPWPPLPVRWLAPLPPIDCWSTARWCPLCSARSNSPCGPPWCPSADSPGRDRARCGPCPGPGERGSSSAQGRRLHRTWSCCLKGSSLLLISQVSSQNHGKSPCEKRCQTGISQIRGKGKWGDLPGDRFWMDRML